MQERIYSTQSSVKFGIDTLSYLNGVGISTSIASEKMPARSPSAGVLDVLSDGKIVAHRRDSKARVNLLHHGIPSGFPSVESDYYDLGALMRREYAEELIYVTRDKQPWIVIPQEGHEEYDRIAESCILESAKRLGFDISKRKYSRVEFEEGPDEIEIWEYEPDIGKLRCATRTSSARGFAYMSWESEHNIALANMRHWSEGTENMLPVDTEGDYKKGGHGHFNREVFVLDPQKLNGVAFGAVLPPEAYEVYLLGVNEEGHRTSVLSQPLYPPIFMPDDGLRRMLDALGVEGYSGKWVELEIQRELKKLERIRAGK